ncbi:MAG: glutamyl-tRNA reductase [Dehalococcoidia bacterium]
MSGDNLISSPHIYLTGVSHETAPLQVRERLSIPRGRVHEALARLGTYVGGGVILATCNRTEIYSICNDKESLAEPIQKFFCEWSGFSQDQLAPHLYTTRGLDAARHLTETAAGLCSMIVGEWEIQGQVRRALQAAEADGMADPHIKKVFQQAIRIGRRVRDETDISRNALSVSSVAVRLAAGAVGDVRKCRVVLVGAGQAGKLVARAFAQRGVADIAIINRSPECAAELAGSIGGRAVDLGLLREETEAADIVISCTGAPHFVVDYDIVSDIMRTRPSRPLVIVDIAVPRDIDTSVRGIEGVHLYDIDDFMNVSKTHRRAREKEIARAMSIIDEEMERFAEQWHAMSVKPVVDALMQKAEDIRKRQLQLTLKKLPPLSAEERESIEAMTRSIVNKILHNPVECLKGNGHDDGAMVETVKELFDIEIEASRKK